MEGSAFRDPERARTLTLTVGMTPLSCTCWATQMPTQVTGPEVQPLGLCRPSVSSPPFLGQESEACVPRQLHWEKSGSLSLL